MKYRNIPEEVRQQLKDYVGGRREPGKFLRAVLEDSLSNALFSSWDYSLESIRDTLMFVYWELPSNMWGNPERVRNYLQKGTANVSYAKEL